MTSIEAADAVRAATYPLNWSSFCGKTFFITGATGFIGKSLIRTLRAHGEQYQKEFHVVALVRDLEKARKLFPYEESFITFVCGDVAEAIPYEGPMDYMVHCASNAAPDQYLQDPVGTMKINFCGTLHSLESARKNGAEKYLYVSTIEVYGKTQKAGFLSEEEFGYIASSNIRSCYPESKKCSETLTTCYGRQYGMDTVIGRLSYIYGAGMGENDTKIGASFARDVARRRDIVLKSAATQKRSYTYISDAVTALLLLLASGEGGEIYNVASEESVTTIAGMAELCCALFPQQGTKVCYAAPAAEEQKRFSFLEDAVLDGRKLRNLGWSAEVPLRAGLRYEIEHNLELSQAGRSERG